MSTDGTQPPSIAPKKPPGARPTAATRTPETRSATRIDSGPVAADRRPPTGAARPRPVSAPLSGQSAPSVGERIRRTAHTVADAARNAVPSRADTGSIGVTRQVRAGNVGLGSSTSSMATSTSSSPSVGGPRKVRLAVARVDPWSMMKLSFLLSVAIGIMLVVAAAVVWYTLDGLSVFTSVNDTITEITGDPEFFNLLEYVAFKRIISLATMVAVVDVVILTALSTIAAFLYNIVAALVGGVSLTLADD